MQKNSPRFCNHPSFTVAASFKVPEVVDPEAAADVDMTDVLVRENGDTESHVFLLNAPLLQNVLD